MNTKWTGLIVILGLAWPVEVYAEAIKLNYSAKQGEKFVYRLEITSDDGDVVRTYTATPQLEVTAAGEAKFALRATNSKLKETEKFKNASVIGLYPRTSFPFAVSTRDHTAEFLQNGRSLKSVGTVPLPNAMGELLRLFVEPRPTEAREIWENTRSLVISHSAGRHPTLMVFRDSSAVEYDADEVVSFRVVKASANSASIDRKYQCSTLDRTSDGPRFELTGRGQLELSRADGFPIRFDGKLTSVTRDEHRTVKVDLRVQYERLAAEEIHQAAADEVAAAAKRTAPLTSQERAEILTLLAGVDPQRKVTAMTPLRFKKPVEPDAELAAALAMELGSEHNFLRTAAAGALANWATEAETNLLIGTLEGDDHIATKWAEEALVRLKCEAAIPAIANRVRRSSTRMSASLSLRSFGPVAEDEVVKLLDDKDQHVRTEAAKILAIVGTEKSLPILRKLSTDDKESVVKYIAGQSHDQLMKRLKEPAN